MNASQAIQRLRQVLRQQHKALSTDLRHAPTVAETQALFTALEDHAGYLETESMSVASPLETIPNVLMAGMQSTMPNFWGENSNNA